MIVRIQFICFIAAILTINTCVHTLPSEDAIPMRMSISTFEEWQQHTSEIKNMIITSDQKIDVEFDLLGDGALLLEKVEKEQHFLHSDRFEPKGRWESKWLKANYKPGTITLSLDLLAYGRQVDLTQGWIKFDGNPVLSGGNTLLPLNEKNISEETLVLPEPGGVPQDQSIVRGTGPYEGKWLLFFNHTPNKWPYEYYWSVAIADSLAPLTRGENPFYIPEDHWPLFGPIDNHAPNDWVYVDGSYYAPDENYNGDSHMWVSHDLFTWENIGRISGINGSDPGIIHDGEHFYLFNEAESAINYNRLDSTLTNVTQGETVLEVGGHTGDADVAFFNNHWHMLFDDGPHLHYNIGWARTKPSQFPGGWNIHRKIYGPHNPEQGQVWDDDTDEGNRFGTGDADMALEGTTLYMFTERPVGAAYRELHEVLNFDDIQAEIRLHIDFDGDGEVDDILTQEIRSGGKQSYEYEMIESVNSIKLEVVFKGFTEQSPLLRSLEMWSDRKQGNV